MQHLHALACAEAAGNGRTATVFVSGDDWEPEIPLGSLLEIDPRHREPNAGRLYLCRCVSGFRLVACTPVLVDRHSSHTETRWRVEYGWCRVNSFGDEALPPRRARVGEIVAISELRKRLVGRVMRMRWQHPSSWMLGRAA